MSTFSFVLRHALAWCLFYLAVLIVWSNLRLPEFIVLLLAMLTLAFVIPDAISHVHRVRMIAGQATPENLRNRQRRQVEVPFVAGEAFDLVDAALRDLPGIMDVVSARDSLRVHAGVRRDDPYGAQGRFDPLRWIDRRLGGQRDMVTATVHPNGDTSTITLACEPESAAWTDWLRVDHGSNLQTAEAITRAITRRVGEQRRGERAAAHRTASAKELSEAKLSLLHAQVEPHFLYNTLASAQVLTRSDPARADQMLGHLIEYLRRSLPRTLQGQSTLGEELERANAWLEIMKFRMGARLATQIDVPEALLAVPFPAMMLQTLVENAIKHGLEPKTGGGTVWIRARESEDRVAVTVADDGRGFSSEGGGTGIGLRNVRERLRLTYGEAASLRIAANFPSGVAATVTVPAAAEPGRAETAHA
ncbi:histidine kinase [Luteimonas sp. RD2P54]|uniref:Histidine kinase n=1 Tax=Luteimonas endophytica TaxID=3042023 RepID=A0ABT6JDZ9_9GAMM|nr:histidine kinase [Luteimonas endophytica]MDH5825045.1 histidine kinase [Luteimonas endophytica]